MNRRPPKHMRATLLTCALLSQLGGCASGGDSPQDTSRSTSVRLKGVAMNAGQIGQAVLTPRGSSTQVWIEVSGLSVEASLPVHLYMYIYAGRCASLPAEAAFRLTRNVLPTGMDGNLPISKRGPFRLVNEAPVSLAQLQATPHALVVRTAPADANLQVFCGDL